MDPVLLFSVVIKTQTEVGIKFWNLGNVFNTNVFKLVVTKKGPTLFNHACNVKEGGWGEGRDEEGKKKRYNFIARYQMTQSTMNVTY